MCNSILSASAVAINFLFNIIGKAYHHKGHGSKASNDFFMNYSTKSLHF